MSYFDVSNFNVGPRQRRGRTQHTQDANAARIDQLRRDAESVTARGFLAEEAAEQADEQERLAVDVRIAEIELNRNFAELHKAERENAFNPAFLGVDGQVHHYEDPTFSMTLKNHGVLLRGRD